VFLAKENTDLHLTNTKSLNSRWFVNTGGDGRGGPKRGTLSSENIFSLLKEQIFISIESYIENPPFYRHYSKQKKELTIVIWVCLKPPRV